MKRICRQCGRPFQPRAMNQKVCSDDCRSARARRLYDERLASERRERQLARFAKIAAQATGVSNIHEAIKVGKSEAFEPADNAEPEPTDAIPGTQDKIELLRQRVEQGQPLWCEGDRRDYEDVRI